MVFSYKTYWDNTFLLPVVMIGLMLILLLMVSYGLWIKPMHRKPPTTAVLGYIFCAVVVIFCSFSQIKTLANGGVYLLNEDENDALVHIGVIEHICEPSERLTGFKSNHCYGADVVIDGEQYFAVTCGDFKEGDCVIVHYLPSSHFVLSIFASHANG